ncbi:ABC transporter permease subunit [bacterium M00.F.Ca.ET.228.01.1.1]|uniref:ABC transporter permease n=1 Tax=Paraburkholderia phenoliruptrix TaxID=252970 RepID=UPI001092DF7D|nr:ABC transporter permease subunit [Paraburkholderia phenoliruptrix]MBW9095891.1 ABC transporter permease subunit [Paraburkholderia phenoliruptrix]TGP48050.1 ABC transporter permease subunit [bacterium M00.F.Ca.ET.228.01.1.1]TGS05842.1 ABC transporter permease subunit [bacterium M00.F.Ca.ET.191.01.1.1]TGU10779.1 ABC transporter permease subunit [bacterium M00.F.Ca.ET.155.01.1.1]
MSDVDFYVDYAPALFKGLLVTLTLTGTSLLIGGLLAGILTVLRATNNPFLRRFVFVYSACFRGTPLLAQLFFVYYGSAQLEPWLQGLGLWSLFSEPVFCAVLAFSLNTAAYQAEIIRGAVNAIQRGQLEAAKAMGFDDVTMLLRIIVPLGLRTAIRPYGNEAILMLKGSAVASVVAIYDLLGTSKMIFSNTYDYRIYLLCAAAYVVMVELLRRILRRFELTLNPDVTHEKKRPRKSDRDSNTASGHASPCVK